ncbi:MAG: hypothetical protein K6360_03930 [Deltaproteobacteria bacterium]
MYTKPAGKLFLSILFILESLSGCGYHLQQGANPAIPSWIKTVYVAPWENRTNELLLGVWITDELRQEFLRSGPLTLASPEEADVILEGEVASVATSGLSYVRYDLTIERRISAVCSVRLVDRKTGDVLWETADISRHEDFLVGRELMETEGLKDEALRKLSRTVAEIIHHRIAGLF